MLKTLASQVKEYKKASIITPIFVTFEVIMELLIPLLMSTLIDNGISTGNMKHVFIIGGSNGCYSRTFVTIWCIKW